MSSITTISSSTGLQSDHYQLCVGNQLIDVYVRISAESKFCLFFVRWGAGSLPCNISNGRLVAFFSGVSV